jgi:hypothetical protein
MFTIVQHDDSLVSIRNFQKRYFCIQLNGEEPPTHPSPHHPIAPHPPPPTPQPPSPIPIPTVEFASALHDHMLTL